MTRSKNRLFGDYYLLVPMSSIQSPKLKFSDEIILGTICTMLKVSNHRFFMSNAYLRKYLKCSQSTLRRSLLRLQDTGFVTIDYKAKNRPGGRRIYLGPTMFNFVHFGFKAYQLKSVQKALGLTEQDLQGCMFKKNKHLFKKNDSVFKMNKHDICLFKKNKHLFKKNRHLFKKNKQIEKKSSASLEPVSVSQSDSSANRVPNRYPNRRDRESRENRNRISGRLFQSSGSENPIDNLGSRSKVATSISNSSASSRSIVDDTSDSDRSIDSTVRFDSPTIDQNSDMNASSDQSSLETHVQSNGSSDSAQSSDRLVASKSLEKVPQKRTSKAERDEEDANVRGYYINHCNQMPSYRAQRKITFIEEHYPQRIGLKALHIAVGKHAHFPLQYAISVAEGLNNDSVRKKHEHNQELMEEAVNIVKMFNHYMHTGYHTFGYNIVRIKKMLKAGFKPDDFRAVILGRIRAWKGNRKMEAYLTRMSVVFGKHFDDYLNSAESRGITGQEQPRHRRHISKAQMRFDSGVKDSVKYLNDINGYIIAADVHKGDKLYNQTLSHAKKYVEKKHGSKILGLALQKADI